MDALQQLIQTIKGGAVCSQESGDGPFVFVAGSEQRFSSRTARRGERLGLLQHGWCPTARKWRWSLTEAGKKQADNA